MKHTYLEAAQYKVKGWVKNASSFIHNHPIVTGGLVGGALYVLNEGYQTRDAPEGSVALRSVVHSGVHPLTRIPREAVASSNTYSARPTLLGNMRSI